MPEGSPHDDHSTANKWTKTFGESVVVCESRRLGNKVKVGEYTIEHEIKTPKRTITEIIYETTYVIPEKRIVEEIVMIPQKLRERIIELATPTAPTSSSNTASPSTAYCPTPASFTPSTSPEFSPRNFEEEIHVIRPKPVEQYTEVQFKVPKIKVVVRKRDLPVYLPRFVEEPLMAEYCDDEFLKHAKNCDNNFLDSIARGHHFSMSDLDAAAQNIHGFDFESRILQQRAAENLTSWWETNQLLIDDVSVASVCSGICQRDGPFVELVAVVRKKINQIDSAVEEPLISSDDANDDF